jgi:hypothetical protein
MLTAVNPSTDHFAPDINRTWLGLVKQLNECCLLIRI